MEMSRRQREKRTDVKEPALLTRITSLPDVCCGRSCIRDTRIEIAAILDGLAEGLFEVDLIDHYPQLRFLHQFSTTKMKTECGV
jgi:uncharacterized protein (DUF433 family)